MFVSFFLRPLHTHDDEAVLYCTIVLFANKIRSQHSHKCPADNVRREAGCEARSRLNEEPMM